MSENLVAITEIPDEISNLKDVLPDFASPERIMVNMKALGRAARWGGFHSAVRIIAYAGESTTDTPMTVGHSRAGEAYMGGIRSNIACRGDAEFTGHPDWRLRTDLTLKLNIEEIKKNLQHSKANLRSPTPWAKQINAGLREGLRKAARQHLLGQPLPLYEKLFTSALTAIAIGVTANDAIVGEVSLQGSEWQRLIAFGFGCTAVLNGLRSIEQKVKKEPLRDGCYSLIPIWHLDRVLVVQGITRTTRLAKALHV